MIHFQKKKKKCMINVDVDLHWGVLTRKYNKQLFYRKEFSIKLLVVACFLVIKHDTENPHGYVIKVGAK